ETQTIVRAAAAEMLYGRRQDPEAKSFLLSCATSGSVVPAVRLSAQQALVAGLSGDEAIALLTGQALDASLPDQYRQATVNQIVDLGLGNSILQILGTRPTVPGGFGLSETADYLSQEAIRLMRAGRSDLAVLKLKRAVEQEPDNPVWHFNLG